MNYCSVHNISGLCEQGDEPSGSIKRGTCLDQLNDRVIL